MIFFKVEEFMLDMFPNKFAKSNVFALLYGVKTWRGSTRKLADALRMPESSLRVVMSELIAEGYIRKTDDGYQCAYAAQQSAQPEEDPAQLSAATAQNCAAPAPLPPTPPITKNIKKEKENLIAREEIATQESPSSSFLFEDLVELYKQRSGGKEVSSKDYSDAAKLWDDLPDWKQQMLVSWLQSPGGRVSNSLPWTISDFKPKPKNFNGLQTYEFDEATKKYELWSAVFDDPEHPGIYTIEEIERFNLVKLHPFKPKR